MIGALLVGKHFQGVHGLVHLLGLHPLGQALVIEPFTLGEEFQPALLFGLDDFNRTFTQFQQPDAAMVDQALSLFIPQPEPVDRFLDLGSQRLAEQPDGVGRVKLIVALAVLQLGAVQIGPAIENAGRQVRDIEQLDFNLVDPPGLIPRLDVNNAELVVEKFALVIGIENLDFDNRGGEFTGQHGVKEMDQQPAISFRTEQGLEYTVHFRIDGVFHAGNLTRGRWIPACAGMTEKRRVGVMGGYFLCWKSPYAATSLYQPNRSCN